MRGRGLVQVVALTACALATAACTSGSVAADGPTRPASTPEASAARGPVTPVAPDGPSPRPGGSVGAMPQALATSPTPGSRGSPSTATAGPVTSQPTPAAAQTSGVSSDPKSLAIFYLVGTGTDLRLAREFHSLPSLDDPASRAQDALIEMIHGRPRDADYTSPWPRGTRVRDVRVEPGVITVDVSGTVRGVDVDRRTAALAVQQLVHTVTTAVGRSDPVLLQIDGGPAGDPWGTGSWAQPVRRAPEGRVRLLAQVDLPADRSAVGRRFVATGSAVASDGVVRWSLATPGGSPILAGTASTGQAQRLSPFRFEVVLPAAEPAGDYALTVTADGGAPGGPPSSDDRTVRIG